MAVYFGTELRPQGMKLNEANILNNDTLLLQMIVVQSCLHKCKPKL